MISPMLFLNDFRCLGAILTTILALPRHVHCFYHLFLHDHSAIAALIIILFALAKTYSVRVHVFSTVESQHVVNCLCLLFLSLPFFLGLVYLRLATPMVCLLSHERLFRMLIWGASSRCSDGPLRLETTILVGIVVAIWLLLILLLGADLLKFVKLCLELKYFFLEILLLLLKFLLKMLAFDVIFLHMFLLLHHFRNLFFQFLNLFLLHSD